PGAVAGEPQRRAARPEAPHAHEAVAAADREPVAVGRDGEPGRRALLAGEDLPRRRRQLPDAQAPVLARRDDAFSVGKEGDPAHRRLVAGERRARRRVAGAPDADRQVLPARDEDVAAGADVAHRALVAGEEAPGPAAEGHELEAGEPGDRDVVPDEREA